VNRAAVFESHDYGDGGDRSGVNGVKWNAIALIGRQGLVLAFSLLLARLLGPEAYGIIAQAAIYIALTTLILDQGLTAALISRARVTRDVAGAAVTVNFLLAAALAGLSVLLAGPIATFFRTPELSLVLIALGMGLILKAAAVVPRMLLMRRMRFKAIAVADIAGSAMGGIAGVVGFAFGADYWALVLQLLVSDLVSAVILQWAARPPAPNLKLSVLRNDAGFSGRVFAGNLISFASRNTDNVLVGRFFGADALAYYSLAYRVLLTPIQMIGQVVTRVLFPAISRSRSDLPRVGELILRSTGHISLIAFPLMGLIAVSAPDTVPTVLGDQWLPAVGVLQVLAITGARQAVTAVNAPVLLGLGLARTHLRFNILAAGVQISGMVAGMPWGYFGVAVGYTVAGILLTPVIFGLQVRHTGLPWVRQLRVLTPAFVGSLVACAAYGALFLTELQPWARMVVGALAGMVTYAAYLLVVHRPTFDKALADASAVVRGRR